MTKKQPEQPITVWAKLLMFGFIGFVSVAMVAPVFSNSNTAVFERTERVAEEIAEASGSVNTAQATHTSWPAYTFNLHVKDDRCTAHAEMRMAVWGAGQYGHGDETGGVVGQSFPYTDSDNNEDPDCLAMGLFAFNPNDNQYHLNGIPLYQSIVSNDFRIGIRLSEKPNCQGPSGQIRWTPWASEGGGSSPGAFTGGGRDRGDCAWLHYEERPLPTGVKIKDFSAGVSAGGGPMQFTQSARTVTSQTDHPDSISYPATISRWSGYSIGSDRLDPARVALDVEFVDFYDAEYVSDTVPDIMDRNQSGNYGVLMRNKAAGWTSDNYQLTSASCSDQEPTQAGQQCIETGIAKSNRFKLKRIDTDASIGLVAPTATGPLYYEREVTKTYTAVEWCNDPVIEPPPTGPPDEGPGTGWPDMPMAFLWDFLDIFGVKQANAQAGGCIDTRYYYYVSSQTPSPLDVGIDVSVNFPLSIHVAPGASSGLHTLQFQMVQLDDNGNEVPGDAQNPNPFGDVANIGITIESDFTLSCGVTQTVTQGMNANYVVSAADFPPGFSSNVNVTMTSNPSGPVLQTSPVVLGPGNTPLPYTATAVVPTLGLNPGTYTLTFNAASGGLTAQPCPAQLVVDPPPVDPEYIDLKFNGHDGPTTPTPANGDSGQLTWTPSSANVVSCEGSMLQGDDPNGKDPWTQSWPPSGSYDVIGMEQGRTYQFAINCLTNLGATVSDSVIVSVSPTVVGPPATVNLKCMGDGDIAFKDNQDCYIQEGGIAYLAWTSEYTGVCDLVPWGDADDPLNSPAEGVNTGNLDAETHYIITCTNVDGVSSSVSDNLWIRFTIPPDPPESVVATNTEACGGVSVTWDAVKSHDSNIRYSIYRGNNLDPDSWSPIPIHTVDFNGSASYSYFDSSASTSNVNYYRISARLISGGPEAFSSVSNGSTALTCTPSLNGSYKKIVGAGSASAPYTACAGGSGFTMPSSQIYQSGDTIYFEICVKNTGQVKLTNVMVQEIWTGDLNLENVQFVKANDSCADGIGAGPYTIGEMEEGGACSIEVKATISNPGGSTSALHYFQNFAHITTGNGVSATVNTAPKPFVIGSGVPTRTETPR